MRIGAVSLVGLTLAVLAWTLLRPAPGARATPAPAPVAPPISAQPRAPVVAAAPQVAMVASPPPTVERIEPPADVPADDPSPSGDATKPDAPIALSEYQRLRGCSCAGKPGGDLHVRSIGRATTISGAGVRTSVELEFVLARGEAPPWRLPTREDTAPASAYDVGAVAIAMGCRDDLVVIAAGRGLSAWSWSKKDLAWSTALPRPFGRDAGSGAELELDCSSLRIARDRVELRVGNERVRVDVRDGSPR